MYRDDPGFRVTHGNTGQAGGGWGRGSGDGQSHHSYGGFPQGSVLYSNVFPIWRQNYLEIFILRYA